MDEYIRQGLKIKFKNRKDYIHFRARMELDYNYKSDGEYPTTQYKIITRKGFFKRNINYIIGGVIGSVIGLIFNIVRYFI